MRVGKREDTGEEIAMADDAEKVHVVICGNPRANAKRLWSIQDFAPRIEG